MVTDLCMTKAMVARRYSNSNLVVTILYYSGRKVTIDDHLATTGDHFLIILPSLHDSFAQFATIF